MKQTIGFIVLINGGGGLRGGALSLLRDGGTPYLDYLPNACTAFPTAAAAKAAIKADREYAKSKGRPRSAMAVVRVESAE
jgi:hypothetical protein